VGGPDPIRGGLGLILGVRFAHVEVLDQTWSPGPYIQGSGTFPWGSRLIGDAFFLFLETDEFVADDSSDGPVNYSRTTPSAHESDFFTVDQPGAPDTVWCTTGQSGVLG
jgi:hypothetical protein